MATEAADEYCVPLVDQRVFGAGIKRKRIAFVPAQNDGPSLPGTAGSNAGSRYLSIVMKTANPDSVVDATPNPEQSARQEAPATCEICHQNVVDGSGVLNTHEASIAHQVCLQHSHPPSHLDRSHVGLRYLQEYGWDPDARRGLGARQEGIRIPVKAKPKNDSAGLGLFHDDEEENTDRTKQKKKALVEEKHVVRLNAKGVRRAEEEKSRRAEQLRRSVYGEDLSQYLGSKG